MKVNSKSNVILSSNKKSRKIYKKIMMETVKAVSESFCDKKAYSGPTPDELKKIIQKETLLPQKAKGWNSVFNLIKSEILPNLLRTSSTDYMAHLHSPALIETLACEAIISAFNQSMDSWDQSPVATEIEIQVVEFLCKIFGYENNSSGIFTSGGSQSNQTAIILARDWFCNEILNFDVKKHGLPKEFKKLRMYTSEISHFSMEKSAHILGLGYESVVKLPVNEKKQIDVKKFKEILKSDKEKGFLPFLTVATAGTTDFGSIDPINEIKKLCDEYKMWLHADAAYGSGIILSEKYGKKLSGIQNCDSITVDFHKMFLMPISASAVLVKNKKNFDFLTIHADYLNRSEDEEDGYTNLVDKSLQTTRRFDALKVWVSFQVRGKDGWSEIITKSMENARYLHSALVYDEDFFVVTEPEISSVVFRYIPKDMSKSDEINKKTRRKLLHNEGVVIGQTISDGYTCLKFTLLNPLISYKKLDKLLDLVKKIAKETENEI